MKLLVLSYILQILIYYGPIMDLLWTIIDLLWTMFYYGFTWTKKGNLEQLWVKLLQRTDSKKCGNKLGDYKELRTVLQETS